MSASPFSPVVCGAPVESCPETLLVSPLFHCVLSDVWVTDDAGSHLKMFDVHWCLSKSKSSFFLKDSLSN